MAEIYYLFRGDEIIYTNEDNISGYLGAGEAHAKGTAGDVLICANRGVLRGWTWNMANIRADSLPWMDIPDHELDPKYKVLLLLQT